MAIDPAQVLESRTVSVGDRTWRAQCVGAQVLAGWRWVHLALLGAPNYKVSLKISPNADNHDTVRALEWWLVSPGRADGDVIEVM